MIKLIIFDLDDTLIQTSHAVVLAREFALRKLRLPLDIEKALAIWKQLTWYMDIYNDTKAIELIQLELLGEILTTKEQLAIVIKEEDEKFFAELTLFPEVREVLSWLVTKNYSLAIHSNGKKDFQMKKLRLTGLDTYFNDDNVLVTESYSEDGKPFEKALLAFIKKRNSIPQETMTVGDRVTDVIAGRLAKVALVVRAKMVQAVEVLEPEKTIMHLETPNVSITHFGEIKNILEENPHIR